MSSDFIGRGEPRTVEILKILYPNHSIMQQVHIRTLIPYDEYARLGTDYSQHKHDIVLRSPDMQNIVIEVNYKHGEIARKKWNIYKILLESAGHKTVTIDDDECRSIFQEQDGIHHNSWQDFVDVIKAFDYAGIESP